MARPKAASLTYRNRSWSAGKLSLRGMMANFRPSRIRVMNMAPKIVPCRLPAPPMRITPTIQRDQLNWKCSGLTARMEEIQKAPAIPPRTPATKYARSLYLKMFTPMASAAMSLSRMAIQARPTRVRRRLAMPVVHRITRTIIT